MPQRAIEKALAKATPIATCIAGPDCAAKWSLAREWVHRNSRFSLAVDSDTALLTYPAIYANTDSSYAVALDQPVGSVRTIRFRAWCGNWIKCYPSPEWLRDAFAEALDGR